MKMVQKLQELKSDLKKNGMYKKYEDFVGKMELLLEYIERKSEEMKEETDE